MNNSIKGLFDLNRTEIYIMLASELDFHSIRHESLISVIANYRKKKSDPVRIFKFEDWACTNVFLYRRNREIEWPCEIKWYQDVNAWDLANYNIITVKKALAEAKGEVLNDLIDIANCYFELDSKQ